MRIGGSFDVHGICALGLKATQGVENPPRIVRRLKGTSREIAQGYYFADPLPRRETSAFLMVNIYY